MPSFLLRKAFWMWVAILVLSVVLISYFIVTFAPDALFEDKWPNIVNGDERGRIGSAEYLAFVIGIPAAVASSIIAIVVAAATNDSTREQARLQAIDMLDTKLTGATSFLSRGYYALASIEKHHGALTTAQGMLDRLNKTDREGDDYTEDYEHAESLRNTAIDGVRRELKNLTSLNKTGDPFWLSTFQTHEKTEAKWREPLDLLCDKMATDYYHAWNIRLIQDRVLDLAEATMSSEFERTKILPEDAGLIERIGAMLWISNDQDYFFDILDYIYDPNELEGMAIYNVGAALLASLAQAIPSPDSIKATAEKVFYIIDSNREAYFDAVPEISEVISSKMEAELRAIAREPNRLIYYYQPGTETNGEDVRLRRKRRDMTGAGNNDTTNAALRSFAFLKRKPEPVAQRPIGAPVRISAGILSTHPKALLSTNRLSL